MPRCSPKRLPPPRRSPRLRSMPRRQRQRRGRNHQFAAGLDRRRQVQHRVGLGRHRARRQASRPTGVRKIRPHPRRQEGARHRRGVLRKPRLRAALDRRRRNERPRQGRGGLSRGRRCRRPRSERISGPADQGRHGARGAGRSRDQVHRRGAHLRPPRHEPAACITAASPPTSSTISPSPIRPMCWPASPRRRTPAPRSTASIRRSRSTRRSRPSSPRCARAPTTSPSR